MSLSQRTSPLVSQLLRLCLLIFAMATVSNVNAQTETTGGIGGRVTSITDGSPIANAVVQITNLDSSLSYRKITKSSGEFRQTLLPPANYAVKVTAPGYEDLNTVVLVVITRTNRIVPVPAVMTPLSATVVDPTPGPTSPPKTVMRSSACSLFRIIRAAYMDRIRSPRCCPPAARVKFCQEKLMAISWCVECSKVLSPGIISRMISVPFQSPGKPSSHR